MNKKDHLGRRGELIAMIRLTAICPGNELPYFVAQFLGDKWELFVLFVELVAVGARKPFFFAQVKSTREGYTETSHRLLVKVPKEDVERMVGYPAPTYLIGIDEVAEKAYIVEVTSGMTTGISSINTRHELNCATLKLLWEEVTEYWKDRDMEQTTTEFHN